jgi:thioesterase domain-containing protein
VNGDDPQLAAFRGDLDDMSLPVTIRYPGWEEMLAPEYRFDDFLDAILRQIDAHRCAGPIRLAGYSLGGLLAFAAAEALLARGREVGFFGILDASLSHAPMMMRRGAFGMIRRMTRVPVSSGAGASRTIWPALPRTISQRRRRGRCSAACWRAARLARSPICVLRFTTG